MKIFSLPFFTQMDKTFFYKEFLPFIKQYHSYIYDIYFAYIMPPFVNDAMGCANIAVLAKEGIEAQNRRILSVMLQIQEKYGIKVSATFNNTLVEPTIQNLYIFMEKLKPLYKQGLRSITIPHYSWMLNGLLKKEFPEMTIKNTVLKRVSRAQEYVDYAKVGFDAINIDRYNLRDLDNLKRLKKAYERYNIPMILLANEWCKGLCPAMSEHYHYNNSNSKDTAINYFKTELGMKTCPAWHQQIPWYHLQNANMPIYRKDMEELLNYIQIFKLHGRSDFGLMKQSMEIVKRYADGEDVVFKPLYDIVKKFGYEEKMFEKWNTYIKNCKFECWDCDVCERLHKSSTKVDNFDTILM